jgi:pre-mRNA-splicing factor CWC22
VVSIQAQIVSSFDTPVYAALVPVINSKIPQIGELVVKSLIASFRQPYLQNDKPIV